jgi:ribonuclease BN (tRNA processing enzyme)
VSPSALELVEGVDLMIHDAQYTTTEFQAKSTWGHCTIDYAVWLAGKAGAKRLALYHHDPSRRDDDLDVLLACATEAGALGGVQVIGASEGLTVEIA